MELIRGLTQLRPHHRGCIATIGKFDGVHLGHQMIIRQLQTQAQKLQLPSVVAIFEPQPAEFFGTQQAPARLTRLREKLIALHHYGVDRVLCLRFNRALAVLSAEEFIRQVLVAGLGVRHLVVGDDFHFGQKRQGHFMTLQQAGKKYGFSVARWSTVILGNVRVSSTRVREALARGDLRTARELLGRPYTLCGRVQHGHEYGRHLGFPTANLRLYRHKSPLNGVFAVKVHGISADPLAGVANLGVRPTINDSQLLLEVHLFDFRKSIYGRLIEVEFVRKLREEKRFDSFEALQYQIQQDVSLAKLALTQ